MDILSAIRGANVGQFIFNKHDAFNGLVISFKSPHSGHIVDDLCYWWVDESGAPRAAPFIHTISGKDAEGWFISNTPPEMTPRKFLARGFAPFAE